MLQPPNNNSLPQTLEAGNSAHFPTYVNLKTSVVNSVRSNKGQENTEISFVTIYTTYFYGIYEVYAENVDFLIKCSMFKVQCHD